MIVLLLLPLLLVMPSQQLFASPEQPDQSSSEIPQVVWSRTDFAPFFILEGEYQNRGISDTVISLFSKEISGYQHKPLIMTIGRMLDSAKRGIPTCHVALLRNAERERFIEYSNPIMINYANGLITSAKGIELLGMTPETIESIDLRSLVGMPLLISVHDGRSYSPVIDKLVAEQRNQDNSIFRLKTGQKQTQQVIRQTLANRLDGFIGRPEEVYFQQVVNQIKKPLYFLEIQGQQSTSLVRVGCTKGDWNNRLFKQINALIEREDIRQKIDEAYLRWIPAQLRDNYLIEQAKIFRP